MGALLCPTVTRSLICVVGPLFSNIPLGDFVNRRVFALALASRVKGRVVERGSGEFAVMEVGSVYDGSRLGLASAAVSTDVDAVESTGVDAHELGGALLVGGAIPGLAKGTASIELASGAEKAAAANPKRWSPRHSMARQGMGRKHCRKARPDTDTRSCQKKANASMRRHLGHCRRRASVNQRRCHRCASASGPE